MTLKNMFMKVKGEEPFEETNCVGGVIQEGIHHYLHEIQERREEGKNVTFYTMEINNEYKQFWKKYKEYFSESHGYSKFI